VTTPIDRSTAAAEGSSIWQVYMKTWAEQIDELVHSGHYADALALLDTVDQAVLSDKVTPPDPSINQKLITPHM
jgi:hypothetical protein